MAWTLLLTYIAAQPDHAQCILMTYNACRPHGLSPFPTLSCHPRHSEVAWTFLHTYGYINFGAAAAEPEQEHDETVVVIGAGLAGELVFGGVRVSGVSMWPHALRSSVLGTRYPLGALPFLRLGIRRGGV